MAFSEPKPKVLKDLLKESHFDASPLRNLFAENIFSCSNMNMGLKQTIAEISAKMMFGNIGSHRSHSDSSGRLLFLDKAFPLIQRRFKLVCPIGEGTFSQIFKAEDLYTGRKEVAVKIVRQAYDALAIRELLLLRYFASKTAKGASPCTEAPYFQCLYTI
jgi:hypothetical protein